MTGLKTGAFCREISAVINIRVSRTSATEPDLEMIRTLQDHGIHQGIEVYMEVTVIALLKDGDRVVGALAYEREHGRFRIFQSESRDFSDRRNRSEHIKSRATVGKERATDILWLTTRARN